jgi:hypothetical protein
MKPRSMVHVVNKKRYSTNTATLVSGDDFWDGHNYERAGRNTFLYKTRKGAFFKTVLTCWQGEIDAIVPLTQAEAIELWEAHDAHGDVRVDFESAFPGVEVEDA